MSPGVMGVTGVLLELAGADEELFGVVDAELLEIMLLDSIPLDMVLLFSDDDVQLELYFDELPELSFDELLELFVNELLVLLFDDSARLLSGRLWTELAVSVDIEMFEEFMTVVSGRLLQPQRIAVESAAVSTILLTFLNFIERFSPFRSLLIEIITKSVVCRWLIVYFKISFSVCINFSILIGFATYPFIPDSIASFLSSSNALAVIATMGIADFTGSSSARIALVA